MILFEYLTAEEALRLRGCWAASNERVMRPRGSVGEKVCKQHIRWRAGAARWAKTRSARLFRRWAKSNPEDAPTKYRFRGWAC